MIFKTIYITAVVVMFGLLFLTIHNCSPQSHGDPAPSPDKMFWSFLQSYLNCGDEQFARLALNKGFPKNGAELAARFMYLEALTKSRFPDTIESIRTGRDVYGYNLIIEELKDGFIVYGRTYTEEKYKYSYARYPKWYMQRLNRTGTEQDGPCRARE